MSLVAMVRLLQCLGHYRYDIFSWKQPRRNVGSMLQVSDPPSIFP